MPAADYLVSNSIRHASALGRHGVRCVYGLYRGPFSFPQSHYQFATGDVRFRDQRSAGASFGKAMPGRLGAVCPPSS